MTRTIVLRPAAKRDLRGIADYSVKQWGPLRAADYIAEVRLVIDRAAATPGIGSDRGSAQSGLRKLTAGAHAIYYFHDEHSLRVSRILHSKQDATGIQTT